MIQNLWQHHQEVFFPLCRTINLPYLVSELAAGASQYPEKIGDVRPRGGGGGGGQAASLHAWL